MNFQPQWAVTGDTNSQFPIGRCLELQLVPDLQLGPDFLGHRLGEAGHPIPRLVLGAAGADRRPGVGQGVGHRLSPFAEPVQKQADPGFDLTCARSKPSESRFFFTRLPSHHRRGGSFQIEPLQPTTGLTAGHVVSLHHGFHSGHVGRPVVFLGQERVAPDELQRFEGDGVE